MQELREQAFDRVCLRDGLDSWLSVERVDSLAPGFAVVECKGAGHPDTLTDNLAESLSRAYSTWCLETLGAVLHHNFDKITTHGGTVEVTYGGGRVLAPVKVMVNGRVTTRCGDVRVPVESLVRETVEGFFAARLPVFADHLDIRLNLTSSPSPGSVETAPTNRTARRAWFEIESIEDLRERHALLANDTSIGSAYAPLSPLEQYVRTCVAELSSASAFRGAHPWCGTDVKVMAVGSDTSFSVMAAVPQVSEFVASRSDYVRNKGLVVEHCLALAEDMLGADVARNVSVRVNARDIEADDELYLTLSGSSLESGDEGVVGRGNRANGLIAPMRVMNVEGVNGKNPVYHVGKVYNVAAALIADRLHATCGGHHEVLLVSATGQSLAHPWRVHVRSTCELAASDVAATVLSVTEDFPRLTEEILNPGVSRLNR